MAALLQPPPAPQRHRSPTAGQPPDQPVWTSQLARAVFHGQRGQLRQRYREGQEDQLGALGLVVNTIVPWNTRYQNAALEQLRRDGHDVRDDDVRRLSPLGHDHINLLGRYQFSATNLTDGQLRPLRDPGVPDS